MPTRATRPLWVGGLVVVMVAASGLVRAEPGGPATHPADAGEVALIERLVAERAALVARERHVADEQNAQLLGQLADRDRALRASLKQRSATVAQLEQTRRDLELLAQERTQLIAELGYRDRQFAAEIAAFREAVTGLARSPNEKKRAALQRYADGDRVGAFPVLEAITRAENDARAKAVNVASAASVRELCQLVLDMIDRGEKQTSDVIACYEEVTAFDPGVVGDWADLADLHRVAGRLDRAFAAAQEGVRVAERLARQRPRSDTANRDLSISHEKLGMVAMEAGKLSEARRRFEKSLAVREEYAKKNPASALAVKRDLSVSYERLGDVAAQAGQLAEARRHFEQGLAIREDLATQDPASAETQRDLFISYNKLGDMLVVGGHHAAARRRYDQGLAAAEKLARQNPTSAEAKRDRAACYNRLGDVAVTTGSLAEAGRRYGQGLAIAEELARRNPSSAVARNDVATFYERLGFVADRANQLAEARRRYKQSLAIREDLARQNPSSALARDDLSDAYTKLGDVALSAGELAEARRRFEQGLAIRADLARNDPTSAVAKSNLSSSYTKLGDVASRTGQSAEARHRFEQGLAIREELARLNPASAEARRDLAVSHAWLGLAFGAEDHLRQALAILSALKNEGLLGSEELSLLEALRTQKAH